MLMLNQLFNRGVFGAKCKTCLNLVISRIKLVQNRRYTQLLQRRREIAEFLGSGQEELARIKVEHVARENNLWDAYEMLVIFCEFVLARISVIESHRECPSELQEAIASIVFAADRCSDLPDLAHLVALFSSKYGKDFVSSISELRPASSVHRTLIQKLSSTPSSKAKLKLLKEIALEYSLHWDSLATEADFAKSHDDLLDGLKKDNGVGLCPKKGNLQQVSSSKQEKNGRKSETSEEGVNMMEKARAVMARAEKACAAAFTAAELLNVSDPTV